MNPPADSIKVSRRGFLFTAGVLPFAFRAMMTAPAAVAAIPAEAVALPLPVGKWLNGIPFFTGFKGSSESFDAVGQWLVAYQSGSKIGAPFVHAGEPVSRQLASPTFLYANVTVPEADLREMLLANDPDFDKYMRKGLVLLRWHMRKHHVPHNHVKHVQIPEHLFGEAYDTLPRAADRRTDR